MTTREDIEAALYRAITGNRLSARTENVPNALAEIGRRFERPWEVAGVSRETWRRWNLPRDRKNAQRPSKGHEAGLLAVLRRLRLSGAREKRIRETTGITVTAWDNYEDVERILGKTTFSWTDGETRTKVNAIMDAYLVRGIGAARDEWLAALGRDGWAEEWLHPDSHGSSQSMDVLSIDFTGDPARAGRGGRTRRR